MPTQKSESRMLIDGELVGGGTGVFASTLRSLADRQEITDLIHRYCRAVDRLDIPLGHSIWHEDATADYGDVYRGDGRGAIDMVCAFHGAMLAHAHHISNISIELDGDAAGSESYVAASLRAPGANGESQITIWGRYIDRWSRRDGRWGLDSRMAVTDFDEVRDVTPVSKGDRSRRDKSDPSYDVLKGLS